MQRENNQPTTYCHSCGRHILTANFLLHQGRCQRMSELRSSRASQNTQKNQKSEDKKIPSFKTYQPRRQPYSYPKMDIKQDFRSMKKKPTTNETQQKIPCPFCGYMQTLLELDTHPQKCEHREISCNFCGTKYPKSLMQQHAYVCQKNPRNIQRNTRPRMRRNQPQQHENLSDEDDGLPMIFQQRNRNMYRPSSLMDVFNQAFFSGGMMPYEQQRYPGPSYQVFQFSSSGNNGQPRVIFRTNSTNPATFIQLIEMLTRRANPNQNPGLNQQELSRLPKVHYHKKNEEPDLCTICYCEFQQKQEIIQLSCKHIFHQQCIFQWLKRVSTCPVCKKKLKQRRDQEQQQFEQYQEPTQHRHHHGQNMNRQQNQGGLFNFFPF